MRELADGAATEPLAAKHGRLKELGSRKVLDAADYPAHIVPRMSEFLSQHRNFRAAWIFATAAETLDTDSTPSYDVLLLMKPRNGAIFREFNLAAHASLRDGDGLRLRLIDEENAECIANLFAQGAPFHTASDYTPPRANRDASDQSWFRSRCQ
jgi:hypothetical protein